jgi:hypothetical protein
MSNAATAAHVPLVQPLRQVIDLPGPRPWPVAGNLLQLRPLRFESPRLS